MSLNEMRIGDYTEALAGNAPVPSGGGTAAMVAALGAALGEMVGNLTLNKVAYAAVETEMRQLLAEAEQLRKELLDCVDGDAENFLPLAEAYKIPAGTPGREEEMERCLRMAAETPLRVVELSCRGILLQKEIAEKGSELLISDAGTGVVLFWAAMYGAALSVRANTKLMRDRAYAEALNDRVDALMAAHWQTADQVYEFVYQRLG